MSEGTCKTCPWWERHSAAGDGGCHYNPPVGDISENWPYAGQDDWCGKHPARQLREGACDELLEEIEDLVEQLAHTANHAGEARMTDDKCPVCEKGKWHDERFPPYVSGPVSHLDCVLEFKAQRDKALDYYGILGEKLYDAEAELSALKEAAKSVTWYDFCDCDNDVQIAVDRLRKLLREETPA